MAQRGRDKCPPTPTPNEILPSCFHIVIIMQYEEINFLLFDLVSTTTQAILLRPLKYKAKTFWGELYIIVK